jgi:aminobenzoyl-glutamate utilization protein B
MALIKYYIAHNRQEDVFKMKPNILPLITLISIFTIAAVPNKIKETKKNILASIESNKAGYIKIAKQIWKFAELGYQETKSSDLLKKTLKKKGFSIKAGVAGIPTSFIASYGKGKPVIAILAEYDALPGMSQDTVPKQKSLVKDGPGHGCGHNLFGTASVAAAVAVKAWLKSSGKRGTLRLYGTPAEEGGSGKVYMVRAGLFNDVDAVLQWHPGDGNNANPRTSLANKSAKFRFYGQSSHASVAPERGRSALDGVEAMNHMVNLLREHIPSNARIHYVITRGGQAPNVVPDFAEVFYYVRHEQVAILETIWKRVEKAAKGAALGTGTRMEYEIIHGNHPVLPNESLSDLMHKNLAIVGGIQYNAREKTFARAIQKTFGKAAGFGKERKVQEFKFNKGKGSTDVGDVSWTAPTAGMSAATWVPGTAPHTWQAVAAGGMSIGMKGMMVAAKTLALTAADLFSDPGHIKAAKKEFQKRRGPDFKYFPLLGKRSPPLDYRK